MKFNLDGSAKLQKAPKEKSKEQILEEMMGSFPEKNREKARYVYEQLKEFCEPGPDQKEVLVVDGTGTNYRLFRRQIACHS